DRVIARLAGGDEPAVRARAARVHHPLGDALPVEVGDFLQKLVIFQHQRAARADAAGVLVVVNRVALPRRQADTGADTGGAAAGSGFLRHCASPYSQGADKQERAKAPAVALLWRKGMFCWQ